MVGICVAVFHCNLNCLDNRGHDVNENLFPDFFFSHKALTDEKQELLLKIIFLWS
jgi:hypothetical protein